MKWEYKTLRIFKQKEFDEFDGAQGGELAKLGSEGWELVSVDSGIAYFKRPLREITNIFKDGVAIKLAYDD